MNKFEKLLILSLLLHPPQDSLLLLSLTWEVGTKRENNRMILVWSSSKDEYRGTFLFWPGGTSSKNLTKTSVLFLFECFSLKAREKNWRFRYSSVFRKRKEHYLYEVLRCPFTLNSILILSTSRERNISNSLNFHIFESRLLT